MSSTNFLQTDTHPKLGIYISKPLTAGNTYSCKCPKCGEVITFTTSESDEKGIVVKCQSEGCGTKVRYWAKVVKPTKPSEPTPEEEDQKPPTEVVRPQKGIRTGVLTWGPWYWRKRNSYELPGGRTTIGRKCADSTCDIQLADPYVSKESVVINVEETHLGSFFGLEVLQVTNDVLLNGSTCPVGSRKKLEEGAIIKIGKTTLRFNLKKSKNSKR